jgi:imidazolonepropionase-like amidohydrolase
VSVLVDDGRVSWIREAGDEGELAAGIELVDASGATIVPGMVDSHSHVTLPGGAHWIDRIDDPPDLLLRVADHNGRLQTQSGIRWARDVGSPRLKDPNDGRTRALALGVRDRWRGRTDRPYIVAAGTWLDAAGTLPPAAHTVTARNADELLANAVGQLDDGADFLKLYLDGPDADVSPWTASEVVRVTGMAHARGAKVTAHATGLAGVAAGVHGGVDSIEHGDELDSDVTAEMARRGTFLVSDIRSDDDAVAVRRRPARWTTAGAVREGPRERAPGPPVQGPDRHRNRLRGRIAAREPARLGGRVADDGGPRAVGGAGLRDLARWRAPLQS